MNTAIEPLSLPRLLKMTNQRRVRIDASGIYAVEIQFVANNQTYQVSIFTRHPVDCVPDMPGGG